MPEVAIAVPIAPPSLEDAISGLVDPATFATTFQRVSKPVATAIPAPTPTAVASLLTGPVGLAADTSDAATTGVSSKPTSAPARDPHVLPTFSRSQSPILYLPPLLSSLPAGVVAPNIPTSAPAFASPSAPRPLSTDSRLPSIDQASLSLHRALHNFRPVTEEYATVPYSEAFNWDELELPEDEEREWYCVAFRSKRRDGSDGGPLYEADKKAHEEAVQNGGLILYWYGTPHLKSGLNLATCIWQSRAHAAAANSRPHHIRAMRLAAASYERYELERYRLQKVKGERHVRVEVFDGGDVGW